MSLPEPNEIRHGLFKDAIEARWPQYGSPVPAAMDGATFFPNLSFPFSFVRMTSALLPDFFFL